VREVLTTVAEALRPVPHEMVCRRAGDPAVLVADSALARRVLGWAPRIPALHDIVTDAVRFHIKRA
jgi:UDP-glucose 4-epimerase